MPNDTDKLFKDMTAEEKLTTLELYYGVYEGLYDAKELLLTQITSFETEANLVLELKLKKAEIDSKIFIVHGNILALKANKTAISPPSAQLKEQVLEIVKSLDVLIAKDGATKTIIAAATKIGEYVA